MQSPMIHLQRITWRLLMAAFLWRLYADLLFLPAFSLSFILITSLVLRMFFDINSYYFDIFRTFDANTYLERLFAIIIISKQTFVNGIFKICEHNFRISVCDFLENVL